MPTLHSLVAELIELRSTQKGLPKNEYRKEIDKKISNVYNALRKMENKYPTVVSKIILKR